MNRLILALFVSLTAPALAADFFLTGEAGAADLRFNGHNAGYKWSPGVSAGCSFGTGAKYAVSLDYWQTKWDKFVRVEIGFPDAAWYESDSRFEIQTVSVGFHFRIPLPPKRLSLELAPRIGAAKFAHEQDGSADSIAGPVLFHYAAESGWNPSVDAKASLVWSLSRSLSLSASYAFGYSDHDDFKGDASGTLPTSARLTRIGAVTSSRFSASLRYTF